MKCSSLAAALALAMAVPHAGPAPQRPSVDTLTPIVLRQDSLLFGAFNRCDTTAFAGFLALDVEFYHDKTGLTSGRDANVGLIAARCRQVAAGQAPRLRRQLVAAGTEVYPVPGFGAIQIGRHRFLQVPPGSTDTVSAEFRFVHLWRQHGSAWELFRIMSYGH